MTERDEHENDVRTEPLGTEVFDSAPDDPTGTPASASAVPADAEPRPRIRFAGIAWGVVFATAALVLLGVVTDPARRGAAAGWLGSLEGDTVAIILTLVFGAVLVLSALLATVRRLQRSRSEG